MNCLKICFVIVINVMIINNSLIASTFSLTKPETQEILPESINENSPRYAIKKFLNDLDQNKDDEALDFLDLRYLRLGVDETRKEGLEILSQIKFIMKNYFILDEENISNNALGNADDQLPFFREKIFTFTHKDKRLHLYLDKLKGATPYGGWKISPLTLHNVSTFYNPSENDYLSLYLPKFLITSTISDIPIWKFFYLVLIFVLSYLLSMIIVGTILKAVFSINRKKNHGDQSLLEDQNHQSKDQYDTNDVDSLTDENLTLPPKVDHFFRLQNYLKRPLRLLICSIIYSFSSHFVSFPLSFEQWNHSLMKTLFIVAIAWIIFSLIDWFFDKIEIEMNHDSKKKGKAPFGKNGIKLLIGPIFLLFLIQNWGVDVTAIIAGLGVGGLAVALAGQKTIENLFGGFVLLLDRPVKIGDFCRFDNQMGTIEYIGLRSTRIRTLDRTLITIPNADFSQMKIENFHQRDSIRFYQVLRVRYETSPDQLRYLLVELKKLLLAHPKIDQDPARVRIVNFNNYSIDIEIFAFATTTDWNEFLAIREDLFLRIIDILHQSGTDFAFPSSTLYLQKAEKFPEHRKKEIELEVMKLKEQGQFWHPHMPQDVQDKFLNTL